MDTKMEATRCRQRGRAAGGCVVAPPDRCGSQRLSLSDFVESVDEVLARKLAPESYAPIGPRTHGSEDPAWTRDVDLFVSARRRVEASVDSAPHVSAAMLKFASLCDDPTLQFRSDRDEMVLRWFSGKFKRAYQSIRVPDKRPWPEFACALQTGTGISTPDVAALALIARVDVACVSRGKLMVAPRVNGIPLHREVVDATTGACVPLGSLVARAVRQEEGLEEGCVGSASYASATLTRLRRFAETLAIDHAGKTRDRLRALVASRLAELDAQPSDADDGRATDVPFGDGI